VLRTPQGFLLVDSSLHGTFVNGDRVQAQRILADGDVIRVGSQSFRFDIGPVKV
jgi:pSer/pThr/pTyr-binding forkhead associated (FHA) protein